MMGRERLALGLAGLWGRALQAHPDCARLAVRDIAFGGKWLLVRLEGGLCGRAFAFTGEHAVYGPLDLGVLRRMGRFVGKPAEEVVAHALGAEGASEFGRLAGCLATAAMNAVCASGNAPEALAGRGLELLDDCVGSLVRPGDRVLVIGAGMFLGELARNAAIHLDVVDMRPACDLLSVHLDAEGVHVGPRGMCLHEGADDTADLLAEADVVFMTGCTLVNGTFFELMALPRRARDVVLFGPSAAGPFEALVELGVTCVASGVVQDGQAALDAVLDVAPGHGAGRCTTLDYTVHTPCLP